MRRKLAVRRAKALYRVSWWLELLSEKIYDLSQQLEFAGERIYAKLEGDDPAQTTVYLPYVQSERISRTFYPDGRVTVNVRMRVVQPTGWGGVYDGEHAVGVHAVQFTGLKADTDYFVNARGVKTSE